MEFIVIIPARYGSTRFPGKPLADIFGKPMIQRVYKQVSKALDSVYIATDDASIFEVVENFGGKAVMTSPDHKSGTDRCAEAIEIIQEKTGIIYDIVINIQGDEPFIQPGQINSIIKCFDDERTEIATLVKKIENIDELQDINKPKVIFEKNFEAIYFSRLPIPFLREWKPGKELEQNVFYKHIGMYAYKSEILQEITKLEQSSLEKAESLEQLRWLENGYKIKIGITDLESQSIDTPEDLKRLKPING